MIPMRYPLAFAAGPSTSLGMTANEAVRLQISARAKIEISPAI